MGKRPKGNCGPFPLFFWLTSLHRGAYRNRLILNTSEEGIRIFFQLDANQIKVLNIATKATNLTSARRSECVQ